MRSACPAIEPAKHSRGECERVGRASYRAIDACHECWANCSRADLAEYSPGAWTADSWGQSALSLAAAHAEGRQMLVGMHSAHTWPGHGTGREVTGPGADVTGAPRGETSRRTVLSSLVTSPEEPSSVRPVAYKGEPLDAERGPGLGCFRFQAALLVVLIILTPVSVALEWPVGISIAFLFITLVLLLFTGQTVIFLLRLVAADRRDGRRRPLGSSTPTVGQLEDADAEDAEDAEDADAEDAEDARDADVPADASPVASAKAADAAPAASGDTPPTVAEDQPADVTSPDEPPGEPGVQE
jgi:hypothetical protein